MRIKKGILDNLPEPDHPGKRYHARLSVMWKRYGVPAPQYPAVQRCKHIWKAGEEEYSTSRCPDLVPSLRVRKKTDPLETRMEKKLEEILTRHNGKFCLTTMTWQAGDISRELFRGYLQRCVTNRTMAETKDHYGRIWYSRPGTKN